MRILLDNAILVRSHTNSRGLARDLLIRILESDHILVLSNEMLYELAKVLRYPRMMEVHNRSEEGIYRYVGLLREFADVVVPDRLLITPIRDINDTVVIQTAVAGSVHVLCTTDRDFFESPAKEFLKKIRIGVLDDVGLMRCLRS